MLLCPLLGSVVGFSLQFTWVFRLPAWVWTGARWGFAEALGGEVTGTLLRWEVWGIDEAGVTPGKSPHLSWPLLTY